MKWAAHREQQSSHHDLVEVTAVLHCDGNLNHVHLLAGETFQGGVHLHAVGMGDQLGLQMKGGKMRRLHDASLRAVEDLNTLLVQVSLTLLCINEVASEQCVKVKVNWKTSKSFWRLVSSSEFSAKL